MPRPCRWTDA